MDSSTLLGVLYATAPVVFLLLIVLSRRARRHGGTLRAGVVGAIYEWQDRDKQKALDVIVTGKAAERHPEYPDGDLPQLESPNKERPREARAQDAEAIARLHIASWQATYARELSPAFLQHQDLAARTAEWRRRLSEGTTVFLLEEGDGIAGFVACGPVRGVSRNAGGWEIYSLHIAPLRQGEGQGSRLFDAAVVRGRERGALELVLWVVKTNSPARAFYERKGMRFDGAEQEHALGAEEKLEEVRYRMVLSEYRGRASGPTNGGGDA